MSHIENKRRYNTNYTKEHYERILLTTPKDTKEKWKGYANRENKSLTRYVMDCVFEHESRLQSKSE